MLLLRIGLYVSVGLAALATALSYEAGYPIEVAMLRGLLAFMAGSLVAYAAELVVATAPSLEASSGDQDGEYDDEYPDVGNDESEPVSLPAIRSERDAAVDDSQAA